MIDSQNITGIAKFTFCNMRSLEAMALQSKIEKAKGKEYLNLINELHDKFFLRSITIKNCCPSVGRRAISMRLSGDTTYSGAINYCALGTTSSPSSSGDIKLYNEVFRKVVSSGTYASSGTPTAYLSTFFTASETSGTYREVGHFIDGTATVNSGQLFSRISTPETAELPLTKAVTESLTIDYRCEIT